MFNRVRFSRLSGSLLALLLAASAVRADSLTEITSLSARGANDTVNWSQLGEDATTLGTSFSATSSEGISVAGSFAGSTPTSIIAAVCPASPCSWANGTGGATPLTAADSLIWSSDAGNSGNGPLTFTLGRNVSGAGALIQEDAPGQFTAEIQVLNGGSSLGTLTESSDPNGDPIYIGVKDTTGANINAVVFSITNTTNSAGDIADFALDALQLNNPSTPSPTPTTGVTATPTQTVTPTLTPTPSPTASPTPTPSPAPTSVPAELKVAPRVINFGKVFVGNVSKPHKLTLINASKPKFGIPITLEGATVDSGSFGYFPAGTSCFTSVISLGPKQRCEFLLGFQPVTTGPASATLTIFDNAQNRSQQILLKGVGK